MLTTAATTTATENATFQHGATLLGSNQAMPANYRFRGDTSDKYRFLEWKRVVFAAVRQIGADVKCLTQKLKPDINIYPVNTVANRRKRSVKEEELKTQEQKVFGAISNLIEPNSRAASVIGDRFFENSNLQGLWKSLLDHFEGNTFAGLYELYAQLFATPSETDDVIFWLQRCYNLLGGTERFERPAGNGAASPHQLSEVTKTALAFGAVMAVPRYATLIADFMREEILDLERFDVPFSTLYKKLTIYVSSRETIVLPPATTTTTTFLAESEEKLKIKSSNGKGDPRDPRVHKRYQRNQRFRSNGRDKSLRRNSRFHGKFDRKRDHDRRFRDYERNRDRRFRDRSRDRDRSYDRSDPDKDRDYERSRERHRDRRNDTRETLHVNFAERRLDEQQPRGFYMTIFCGLGESGQLSVDKLHDTGATATMFNESSRNLIFDLEPCTGDVIGAGGMVIGSIEGKGKTIYLGREITVYYAPRLPKSVISVSQLTKEYDFIFMFSSVGCVITTKNGEKLSETELKDGLYIAPDSLFTVN